MTEIEINRNWWNKNWKWLTSILGILIIIYLTFSSTDFGEQTYDVIKAYADPDLVEKALVKANKSKEVQEFMGTLGPIDGMAKLEGAVKYSNNDTTVDISVRVKGAKGKGRMRINAERKGENWEYRKIHIGIKKPNRIIMIID